MDCGGGMERALAFAENQMWKFVGRFIGSCAVNLCHNIENNFLDIICGIGYNESEYGDDNTTFGGVYWTAVH